MAHSGQPRKPDAASAEDHERNQYIPSFIAKKPFYVPDDSSDYLEHQRLQREEDSSLATSKWYDRGSKAGPAATKFRKGACANCGAMTHPAKQCLSRPRKQGARWTGRDIAADERVQDVSLGWDAKRDRWNGYDAEEYQRVVDEFNEVEALKKERRAAAADAAALTGEAVEGDGEDGDRAKDDADGARYEEEAQMGRTQAGSTRNLRLREDTAKYLLDLNLDSAKYDPKTRSMRDAAADEAKAREKEDDGADEGFVRKRSGIDGDGAEFEKAQRYAWEAQERAGGGVADAAAKLHLQANPTEGEVVLKRMAREAEERRAAHRKALLDRYGGEEYLSKSDAASAPLVTESERFVEYDESGGIKGAPKVKPRSKYAEDVYVNNHTSVWGSWWANFQWGYACCHSIIKQSYCTGSDGIKALEDEQRRKAGLDVEYANRKELEMENEGASPSEQIEDRDDGERDRRKRRADEMHDGVTEEDMEEYKRKRNNFNDPMAKILG